MPRAMPADFPERAPQMSREELCRFYSASNRSIAHWVQQSGVKTRGNVGNPSWNKRPLPDDFAEIAPKLSKNALRRRYNCSGEILNRWLAEAGVSAREYDPKQAAGLNLVPVGKINLAATSKTIFDCAADVLRRERFTVYRCDDRGRFDLKGEYWRIGFSVLTGDELLERAAKYERVAA